MERDSNTPGFHRTSPKPGLPCEQCGRPTDIPLYDVYECDKCQFTQDVIFPNQKKLLMQDIVTTAIRNIKHE